MALTPTFFFREDFPNLDNDQIKQGTRALLAQDGSLSDAFSITVQDTHHSFHSTLVEAKEITLELSFWETVGKVFWAIFSGRDEERLTPPNQIALTRFFSYVNQEPKEVARTYKQGLTIRIYVSKDRHFRYLECNLSGGLVPQAYLFSYGIQTGIMRFFSCPKGKLYSLLDTALCLQEVKTYLQLAQRAFSDFSSARWDKNIDRETLSQLSMVSVRMDSYLTERIDLLSSRLYIEPGEIQGGPIPVHNWKDLFVHNLNFSLWVAEVKKRIGEGYKKELASLSGQKLDSSSIRGLQQELAPYTYDKYTELSQLLNDSIDAMTVMESTSPHGGV